VLSNRPGWDIDDDQLSSKLRPGWTFDGDKTNYSPGWIIDSDKNGGGAIIVIDDYSC